MILQKKPQHWMCGITSFAMVLDIPVKELCELIGHDGGEIVSGNLRRGFHQQELIEAALNCGYAVTPVELFPVINAGTEHIVVDMWAGQIGGNYKRFDHHVHHSRGVIEGKGMRFMHMLAYEHGMIYDPDGSQFPYCRHTLEQQHFFGYCLWRFDKIR
jgi:hypothetical protein